MSRDTIYLLADSIEQMPFGNLMELIKWILPYKPDKYIKSEYQRVYRALSETSEVQYGKYKIKVLQINRTKYK